MLTALGDTAFLAWSLPLLAAALLFGVYIVVRADIVTTLRAHQTGPSAPRRTRRRDRSPAPPANDRHRIS